MKTLITLITFLISIISYSQNTINPNLLKNKKLETVLLTEYYKDGKKVFKESHVIFYFNEDGTRVYTNEKLEELKLLRIDPQEGYDIINNVNKPYYSVPAKDYGGSRIQLTVVDYGIDKTNKNNYLLIIKYSNLTLAYNVYDTDKVPEGWRLEYSPFDTKYEWGNMDNIQLSDLMFLMKLNAKVLVNPVITEKDVQKMQQIVKERTKK